MAPAERAERELRGFWRPDSSEAKDGRRLLAIFRDTIRDAENDARSPLEQEIAELRRELVAWRQVGRG